MNHIKRVLIIDDDNTCVYLAKLVLKSLNMDEFTESAKNGIEGLAKLKQAYENDVLPDLILLDIKMPLMDGFAFLKEVEKQEHAGYNKVRIVLLSSSQNPWEIERAKSYRAAAFLHKPLTKEKLQSILA